MLIELIEFFQIVLTGSLDDEDVGAADLLTVLVKELQRHSEKRKWLLAKPGRIVCLLEAINIDL